MWASIVAATWDGAVVSEDRRFVEGFAASVVRATQVFVAAMAVVAKEWHSCCLSSSFVDESCVLLFNKPFCLQELQSYTSSPQGKAS